MPRFPSERCSRQGLLLKGRGRGRGGNRVRKTLCRQGDTIPTSRLPVEEISVQCTRKIWPDVANAKIFSQQAVQGWFCVCAHLSRAPTLPCPPGTVGTVGDDGARNHTSASRLRTARFSFLQRLLLTSIPAILVSSKPLHHDNNPSTPLCRHLSLPYPSPPSACSNSSLGPPFDSEIQAIPSPVG